MQISPNLFIYEFVTGGGFFTWGDEPPGGSLLAEGLAMVQALCTDAIAAACHVTVMQDARLAHIDWPAGVAVCRVESAGNHDRQFAALAKSDAATILVAPECDATLFDLCRRATEMGAPLLSPDPTFVSIASDKWRCHQLWRDAGVPTPETWCGRAPIGPDELNGRGWVLKPRDGVGSLQIRRCDELNEWEQAATSLADLMEGRAILQRFVPGCPASCAAICQGERSPLLLTPCWQHLSDQLEYQGGSSIATREDANRAHRLAAAALRTLPPTRGYVGVDLVLGQATDGSEDFVIEVNPRVTTSYVGLRQLYAGNLVAAMLDPQASELSCRRIKLQFDPCGRVWEDERLEAKD
ncbi:MAG: ATP-grasp domain-containing protein [Planctomycetales bacterium]|nr:ATP-grasp domain-containing protein [Planctomycetales bacterium]